MVESGLMTDHDPHSEGVAAESFSAAIPNRLYRDSSKICGKRWISAGSVPDTGDRFTGKSIKRNTLVTDIKEKMEEKI